MKRSLIVLIIIVLIIFGVILYARFIGTKGFKIKEYKVVNSKITDDYHGLKIVHLSDIHYGSTIFEEEMKKVTEQTNLLKPDIVVLTGDLLDENYEYNKEILIKYLKEINATLGKYAITGNHDVDIDVWEEIIKESNFINLNDTYDIIYGNSNDPIIISGLSSNYLGSSTDGNTNGDISIKTREFDTYISELTEDNIKPIYSILLIHEPDFIDDLNLNNYDLILSGHSHGGQVRVPIIGAIIKAPGAEKYYNEYYNVSNTDLYISSGIGTRKLKLRLFNKPSLNFYRITKK